MPMKQNKNVDDRLQIIGIMKSANIFPIEFYVNSTGLFSFWSYLCCSCALPIRLIICFGIVQLMIADEPIYNMMTVYSLFEGLEDWKSFIRAHKMRFRISLA